jgi:anaerobic sulfite reductase subunit B
MSFVPRRYRVLSNRPETADTASLVLAPVDEPIARPRPGQFTMLYAFGVGEVPISVSGAGETELVQTIRAVGAVSAYLRGCQAGDIVGVRGPFGTSWEVPAPAGHDLVIMGGGIGLAPLRPVIRHAVRHRERYRRVAVLIGARSPAGLLFPDEYRAWQDAGIELRVTVDQAGTDWDGQVGVITAALDGLAFEADRTSVYVCGPEVMLRFCAQPLMGAGVPAGRIQVSLERNMRCGDALCGHCQLGPLLICRDGPVVGYDRAEALMAGREL